MTNKSTPPDYTKKIVVPDATKGYTGHKLPVPPPQPQTPSKPTSTPANKPTSSEKK